MRGLARKVEAARHDRDDVEQDAGKRRRGIRKYLALGHRSLYMSGNRTKESIIGFLKKVNRDACGRAGRPQFHAFARAGPRSAARLRTPPLALGGRSGAYQRTQPAEREPDRKGTRMNASHQCASRMPSSASKT